MVNASFEESVVDLYVREEVVCDHVIRSTLKRVVRRLVRPADDRAAPPPHPPKPPASATKHRVHDYWRRPDDGANGPEAYLEGRARCELLLRLTDKYQVGEDAKILELGCNVGRNLEALRAHGHRDLTAIEISADALALLAKHHAELANTATLHCGTIESVLPQLPAQHFDLVYTMAVLEHIHTESEWIFADMVRVAKRHVITIEDEACRSWRHFPRDYAAIFSGLGLEVVERFGCDGIEGLGANFQATVFAKPA